MSDIDLLYLPSPANGVPTGIEIVGRTCRHADVLRAGMACEQACGQWFTNRHNRPNIWSRMFSR
jgi:hypothetical protein